MPPKGGIFYGYTRGCRLGGPTKETFFMIHQYKLGGYNIVLDVCSGSVHVVDEVAYDVIARFP